MAQILAYDSDFERSKVLDKIDNLEIRLLEEQNKAPEERNPDKEFELMYARMIAGLKLNTGARWF